MGFEVSEWVWSFRVVFGIWISEGQGGIWVFKLGFGFVR